MKLTSLILLVLLSGCLFELPDRDAGLMDDSMGTGERAGLDDFLAGMTLFNRKDYAGARRRFSYIIEKYPGSKVLPEAQWMIAKSYDDEGDINNALEEYRLFLKNYPDSVHSREVGSRIEAIDKKRNRAIKNRNGEVIGIKLTEKLINLLTAKDSGLLHQHGINTLILELPAGPDLARDDLRTMVDISHRHGFQIFVEINMRDPGWIDDPETLEAVYNPGSRMIVKSDALDLFNKDVAANMAMACRDIAITHPDGIILKGYGYSKYEGLGRYIRAEFYKDFGFSLEPENLFMASSGLSVSGDNSFPPDFWHWAGWKGRKIYELLGRIMKGCGEVDRSIKFTFAFHSEAIDDPPAALSIYSEDILEANRYRPDYALISLPKDGADVSLFTNKFSRYITGKKLLLEVSLADSSDLANNRLLLLKPKLNGSSGIIFSKGGMGFKELELF